MSHNIDTMINVLDYCEGILWTFADFYQEICDTSGPVFIDTGVYNHLYKEDRNYDRDEDIFTIETDYIERDDVVLVLKEIKSYLEKFESARSFIFSSICKTSEGHYIMYWDS